MKKLEYNGTTFYYEIFDFLDSAYTKFYDSPTMKRKKFFIFGEEIEVRNNKSIFNLDFNIKNPNFSKEYVRDALKKELVVLNRKEEVENGEII